jgi:uncharacterized protein YqgC (DUF456 family)
MEITLNFEFVNWFAVLSATVVSFILAGAWYSPAIFGRVLSYEYHDQGSNRNVQAIFVVAYILQWLAASLLAAVLGPNSTGMYGLNVGLLVGCFFATTAVGITDIIDNKPVKHLLVNGGYHILSFSLMGFIIGSWH